ncbi:hypothetical protein M378DRAFT_16998 [Amanita muscaria Koide BX008]|uniref:Uncharacterized protein n=1 Tax=Amanita muscaria (strain Koide BX008) TaxID=946122 RepID=A0A0C2W5Z6_AMAMK|nr:hypothetical protein M378DRAFT_16998 [Amanita muscaria Koide BX008]
MRRGARYPHLYIVKEDGEPPLGLWALSALIQDRADVLSSSQQFIASLKDKVALNCQSVTEDVLILGLLKNVGIRLSQTNTGVYNSHFQSIQQPCLAARFQPSTPSVLATPPDRPLLIAPAYKWQALSSLIKSDPYLSGWNDTIFGNATQYFSLPPAQYFMDEEDQGIRLCLLHKWADRSMTELQKPNDNAKWSPQHFLDTAEMSSTFGIAYDWFYDHWSDAEKRQVLSVLIQYGLQPGLSRHNKLQWLVEDQYHGQLDLRLQCGSDSGIFGNPCR